MPLKQFTIDFQNIGQQEFLRPNVGYRYFFDVQKGEIYPSKQNIKLKYVLKEILAKKVSKGELEDSETLVDIGNIERRFNNLIDLAEVDKIGSDKSILRDGDIVIPKMQPQMGNMFLNLEHKRYIGSTELLEYSISEDANPLFLYYLITSKKFLSDLANLESGKTHRRVNPADLLKIKIPLVPKPKQDQIVARIEPIERKIKELKSQITPAREIINKIFAREFGFDENFYDEFGKGMTAGTQAAQNRTLRAFETDFSELSRSGILRFSTRFHNTPTKKLMDFLDGIKTLKVNDIIESYEKGIQPKYNPDGEIPVVKIANLKNGYIDFSETENILQENFDKLDNKKKLRHKDIIICATGKVSLGKIDFYDYENEAITSVDNYILRLNKKYNPLFFTYFFRSILGYFQIERDFTGATNQIHLYWDQISSFQIPDIPLKSQQKIVDEIKTELDRQEKMKKKIESERNKIDEIIEKAINSTAKIQNHFSYSLIRANRRMV